MTEWDIQPRSNTCSACQQPFGERQVYHTLLAVGAAGYTRRDLCGACIASVSRDSVISYWQGEYKAPLQPPPEAIQKETAETLLRKLVELNDPNQAAACYILAVMLERKRILKHRDTVTDTNGAELLVYEHARSGESFTVADPHLRLDQLEEVQQRVTELLQPAQKKAEAEPTVDPAPADSAS